MDGKIIWAMPLSFSELKEKYGFDIKFLSLPGVDILRPPCPERDRAIDSEFMQILKRDVLLHGYENPILAQAGKCSPYFMKYLTEKQQENISKMLVCDFLGATRLYMFCRSKTKFL